MPSRTPQPATRAARPGARGAESLNRPPAGALAGFGPRSQPSVLEVLATGAVVAFVMLVLDLAWLGIVAVEFYDRELGALKRPDVVLPAAIAFYLLYVVATVRHAVVGASGLLDAGGRGVGLGFVAYGTYEFTNWAVISGWPVALVPIDLLWGMVLTGIVSVAGRAAYEWIGRRRARPM